MYSWKPLTVLAAVVFCLAVPRSAPGVDFSRSTGNELYNDGQGHTMPYRLFLPIGYDPLAQTHYPLVLFMHGAGERGTDNTSQCGGGHLENLFAATQGSLASQYKAFLLAPQVPNGSQWVDWPWASGSYTNAQEPPESQSMKLAMGILDQVVASYPVDSNRIYVTGLSMGGFGAWDAIRRHPGEFAAAMPLSGGGNKDQGLLLSHIPVWAYHGASDGTVPVSGTDNMRDAIAAAGGSIEYTRPDGVGHSGWNTFYDNTTYHNSMGQTVYPWLFSQAVPEPSTLILLGAALLGLLAYGGRRCRR